jgi:hypothetical protein
LKSIGSWDWIENLGKIRDGLFLLISAIYVMGYIVWAIVAWHNNLGFMPVLQAQYFVAGCPIFIAIVLAYYLIRLLYRVAFKWWPILFDNLSFRSQHLISSIFSALQFVLLFTMIYFSRSKEVQPCILATVCGLIIILPILSPTDTYYKRVIVKAKSDGLIDEKTGQRNEHISITKPRLLVLGQKGLITILAPILVCIYLTYVFINTYYIKIPQEFGGAKPRSAVLDLVKSKFSAPTLQGIIDSSKVQLNSDILQSKQVNIYFNGGTYILIGKFDTTMNKGILEIPRDAIISIHWLAQRQDI